MAAEARIIDRWWLKVFSRGRVIYSNSYYEEDMARGEAARWKDKHREHGWIEIQLVHERETREELSREII